MARTGEPDRPSGHDGEQRVQDGAVSDPKMQIAQKLEFAMTTLVNKDDQTKIKFAQDNKK